MAVFETVTQTVSRPQVSNSDLGLTFDLGNDFCAAAWSGLEAPIEAVLAATGRTPHEPGHIHLTKPLQEAFIQFASKAIKLEARRLGVDVPGVVYNEGQMTSLVAACINHMHTATAHCYEKKSRFEIV